LLNKCACGNILDIRLRTLIYSRTVEIDNVPIYSCDACFHSEIIPSVKSQLNELLKKLGSNPIERKLNFNDICEWANLITLATDKQLAHLPIQAILSERIDQLLDLLLLARSLDDEQWIADLRSRLSQITNPVGTA